MLNDRKAIELVEAIDYDFAEFRGPSLAGSVYRASMRVPDESVPCRPRQVIE